MDNNNLSQELDSKIDKSVFVKIGLALFASIVVTLLLQSIITGFTLSNNPDFAKGPSYLWIMMGVVYIIGMPLLYLIIRGIPIYKSEETSKYSLLQLIGFYAVCTSAMYLFNIVGILVNLLISKITGIPIQNPLESLISNLNSIFILAVMVLIGPIVEEIIFRKVILDRVRVYGDKFAIVFTAFVFGLYHGNFSQFFYAFALGVVFAYITLRTNTIKYSIIFHILINFMGSFAGLEIAKIAVEIVEGNTVSINQLILFGFLSLLFFIAFILFIAGFVVFFMNYKNIKLEDSKVEATSKEINRTAYLNIGFILFFLVSITQFILVITGVFGRT